MRRILQDVSLVLHAEVLDLSLQLLDLLTLAVVQVHPSSLEVLDEHEPHTPSLLPPLPHTLGCHGSLESRIQPPAPVQLLNVRAEVHKDSVGSLDKGPAISCQSAHQPGGLKWRAPPLTCLHECSDITLPHPPPCRSADLPQASVSRREAAVANRSLTVSEISSMIRIVAIEGVCAVTLVISSSHLKPALAAEYSRRRNVRSN